MLLGSVINNIEGGNTTTTTTSHTSSSRSSSRSSNMYAHTSASSQSTMDTETGNDDAGSGSGSVSSNGADIPSVSVTTSSKNKRLRGELNILLGATVRRILFDTTSGGGSGSSGGTSSSPGLKHAVGVEYAVDGKLKTAYLHKPKASMLDDYRSIIITAGSIMTPKILLLSGIGPSSDLIAADIPVLIDSPTVGKHLYDHPVVGLTYTIQSEKLKCKYCVYVTYYSLIHVYMYTLFHII